MWVFIRDEIFHTVMMILACGFYAKNNIYYFILLMFLQIVISSTDRVFLNHFHSSDRFYILMTYRD